VGKSIQLKTEYPGGLAVPFTVGAAIGLALYIIYKIYDYRRSEGAVRRRVARKLRQCAPRDARVYSRVLISDGDRHVPVDHLAIGSFGVIVIKNFNWGMSVYGEPRSETWKIEAQRRKETCRIRSGSCTKQRGFPH
jgi:hypothetical protein